MRLLSILPILLSLLAFGNEPSERDLAAALARGDVAQLVTWRLTVRWDLPMRETLAQIPAADLCEQTIPFLDHGDLRVVIRAADFLREQKCADAVPVVLGHLRSTRKLNGIHCSTTGEIREYTIINARKPMIAFLAEAGDKRAVPVLETMLDPPHAYGNIGYDAAKALYRLTGKRYPYREDGRKRVFTPH